MKFNFSAFMRPFVDGCVLCGIIQYFHPPAEGSLFGIWLGWSLGCVVSGFIAKD